MRPSPLSASGLMSVFAMVTLGMALPHQARAQGTSSSAAYPLCAANQSSKADSDAAHGAFLAGRASFDEADYPTAINYFRDAYRRDCTKHELLTFIARAYEAKGDIADAVTALETFLKRAPNDPSADQVQRRVANLKERLAKPSEGARKDSEGVAPPPVTSVQSTSPEPASTERSSSHHSVLPWIVVGVGGAAVVTGVVLILSGASKVSSSVDACPLVNGNHVCSTDQERLDQEDKNSQGHNLETVGAIVTGVGAAAVVGGLIWHFLEPSGGQAKSAQRTTITPDTAPGYAGISLRSMF